jgi:hypothetical protein
MTAVTLATLRARAQVRADMENSTFVTTANWNIWINAAADELYDLLVRKFNDRFTKSQAFVTVAGTETYALPTDFYDLRGLELQVDGINWKTLRPFDFANRNAYRNAPNSPLPWHTDVRYWLKAAVFHILPVPTTVINGTVWYIPTRTQMASDSDTFDGVSGWEEYVVVDTAIRALAKEESDTSQLMAEKSALLERINRSASNRDAGMPRAVQDTQNLDREWW